jgi:hypothetical protein
MHMEDGLPGIGVGVEDHPIPTLEDALELGNLTSSSNNVTQQPRIPGSKLGNVPVPLLGHDKHVHPSLRPNIPKGKGGVILIDNVSRDLPTNDPFEESLILTHTKNPIDPQQTTHAPSQTTHSTEGRQARRSNATQRNTPFEQHQHKSRGGPGLAPAGGLGV